MYSWENENMNYNTPSRWYFVLYSFIIIWWYYTYNREKSILIIELYSYKSKSSLDIFNNKQL